MHSAYYFEIIVKHLDLARKDFGRRIMWVLCDVNVQVAATPDLMLAHLDFFLGGDEKRNDLPPPVNQRFPMPLLFGGEGSYMAYYSLQSDDILTSLLSQVGLCGFVFLFF